MWHGDITSPFPPSGNGDYVRNLDVPYLLVTTSYVVTTYWGPYGKRHKLNPVTTLWHADVDKRAHDGQMPCKRLQPSYRPSANSLTLVPTGTTEYIAGGDSQAAVPFPMEIGRDFDLQWKAASGLSYLLLQLAVMAGKRAFWRRALRRPHPARNEVTCRDTDMDWPRLGAVLHMTGLWGRSYLGVGRRAQSDCRGCLEDSTRVHRPGNWTGGEKRRSYPRVRGNGAESVTPAGSSRSLFT